MPDERPDPDRILERVEKEAEQETRGRLKVFFGAAPGVGKTYAMLNAARLHKTSGADVVAGYAETHGRAETEVLLAGIETLPRRKVPYRGIVLEEFDLDAALARRPALILVDELAHSNAAGSRHAKRWQDVFELIDAGIDVYTTLNVQHLDSLNDVVAQITGVTVRETVPDSVLDRADDLELVDLPVEELRARLEQGKVYIPDQARRAMDSFFRPGNLIALRQLALRRTADRVDAQLQDYRRDHSIDATWAVAERLLISIGPSPFSARLIRAGRRIAAQLGAEWIVAFVETSEHARQSADVRERVLSSLRLAEQLGAETVTLTGDNVTDTLLHYARSRNVTRIVVGKYATPLWKRLLRGSILDELIERSGEIEIYAIRGEPDELPGAKTVHETPKPRWREFAGAAAIVAVCAVISLPLRGVLAPANLVMLYLLGVLAVASRYARQEATLAAVLSVAAFDFFCVPPFYTFAVADYEYVVTFAVMLVVALVVANLTVRTRQQAANAVEREARTAALYRLSRQTSGQTRAFETARIAARVTSEVFHSTAVIFLADEGGRISFHRRTSDHLPVPMSEEAIAQWVFDHGEKAGKGMDTLPGATVLYVPLKGSQGSAGVLALAPTEDRTLSSPEQHHLLEIFANQIALLLERAQAAAAARVAAVQMEAEQMRSSLLSAVSHDLRTPLASITGSATSLLEKGSVLSAETQRDLTQSIADEADRLSRLVNNLLEMTRLDSGTIRVSKDWHPLEEIVGAALERIESILRGRDLHIDIPVDLPMVSVDDVLMGQVFVNLLENAAKYTPPDSPIEIAAWAAGPETRIEVRDRGPGFSPGEEKRVFEKFYRGRTQGARGAGLGLAICQAIVRAHDGSIAARNREGGGAVIEVRIPSVRVREAALG